MTVRCADSLPREAVMRLAELSQSLRLIDPRSGAFADLQRETFRTLEKYLDAGRGSCPLKSAEVAKVVAEEFANLSEWHVQVPHFTVMPNHWHAMIVPSAKVLRSLSEILKRLKGRTAKAIRRLVESSGPVWQREWFDRWMRTDAEWEKCVAYIRANPLKAGLVKKWREHPYTK